MKIKPQHFVLIVLLSAWAVLGILFGTNNMGYLFSRSIDIITTKEGEDPKPAIESLDTVDSQKNSQIDTEKLLKELREELLKTENDPDKAMEIRRRIQALETEK